MEEKKTGRMEDNIRGTTRHFTGPTCHGPAKAARRHLLLANIPDSEYFHGIKQAGPTQRKAGFDADFGPEMNDEFMAKTAGNTRMARSCGVIGLPRRFCHEPERTGAPAACEATTPRAKPADPPLNASCAAPIAAIAAGSRAVPLFGKRPSAARPAAPRR